MFSNTVSLKKTENLQKQALRFLYKSYNTSCEDLLRGHKGFSFCKTAAKKSQNMRPAACRVIILRLRHHQNRQVAIYIDPRL